MPTVLNEQKRMPFSNEAEKAIMGCMLSYPETIDTVLGSISYDSFYNELFQVMYTCISELRNDGINVDFVTVRNKMLQKKIVKKYGDKVYERKIDESRLNNEFFVDLADNAATGANVKDYCKIVKDKYVLRRLIKICDSTSVACQKDEQDVDLILESAEKEIFKLQKNEGQKEFLTLKQIWPDLLMRISAATESKDGITGVPTGFRDLDYLTSGFQPANFIVIAARPGMGKTSLSLSMAYNMAFKKNKKVAFFTLEMNGAELAMRILSSETKISSEKIRSGRITDEETDFIYSATERLINDNLILDETSYLTIAALRSKCRKLQSERGLDIIMIDYLQLISTSKKVSNRVQEISEITRQLKIMAKDLDIPIICLSQLSRASEQRNDHRPVLSDLRDSGSIEQDADIVMMLYRPGYYSNNLSEKIDQSECECIVAKNRYGETRTVKLYWRADCTKFSSLDFSEQT